MKKTILLALCIGLAGMLAVNGTFADDFTKAVSEAVQTLFQTVSGLAAGVSSDPTTDPDTFKVSLVYPDGGTEWAVLSPGSTTERKVAVENQSSGKSAYFRIAFAVQADVRQYLTLNFNSDDSAPYTWSEWREDVIIGGRAFDLIIGTYTGKLGPGATSAPALLSVTLNDITNQQLSAFAEDFLQIRVLAVCADDFKNSTYTTAEAALDQALPISESFNPFQ